MSTRLHFIQDWESLAQKAGYRPGELAKICEISLRTLERFFQRKYNLTVGQWLKELRLARAYDGLKEGKQVKAVAFDFGYKQVSHFSREFKAFYGTPPSMVLSPSSYSSQPIFREVSPTLPQLVLAI